MRNYQTGKERQHEDGHDEKQQQIRDFMARSVVDMKRPRLRTKWCEVQLRWMEIV